MLSYLKSLFGVVCVYVPLVESIVELLELEQILVCRAKRAHPIVLADVTEKHHSGPFFACLDSCPPIFYASEFAEPNIVSTQQSAGLE